MKRFAMRLTFILALLVFYSPCDLRGVSVPDKAAPNILFIIADDLGWADVGYHGSDIDTPNIDRLAREGVILERHYVTPMCSSTRACLQSGRYSTRFGLDSATNNRVFPPGTTTLASALREAGYDTAITGKWHLGSKPDWGPLQHGFDRSHGSLAGGVDQYTHRYKRGNFQETWHRDDALIEEDGHSTDLIARQAVEWIEADRAKPFFIQVAFTAVHVPIQEPDEWISPYRGRIANESRRRFAACATHMDHAIGRMVEALERTGKRAGTLIVFTSDNGGSGPWEPANDLYPGTYDPCPVLGSNEPLRGRKGTVYEGGVRVPAFANWPGRLAPVKLNHPVHIVDWMPTLLTLSGGKFPPSLAEDLRWDGRDVWPLFTGLEKFPESRILYFKRGDSSALLQGRWKLVRSGSAKAELFNLDEDPAEKNDLAPDSAYQARVAQLEQLLAEQQALDQQGPAVRLD